MEYNPIGDLTIVAGDECFEIPRSGEHDRREVLGKLGSFRRRKHALESVLCLAKGFHWHEEGTHEASLGIDRHRRNTSTGGGREVALAPWESVCSTNSSTSSESL